MTVVVFGSARGAPGVTTAALLVAAGLPGGAVLEADLDGGTLAARFRLGREPGVTTLAAARSVGAEAWRDHAQSAGGVPVVVGPDAPEAAAAVWATAGRRLAGAVADADASFVVDVGRLRNGGPAHHLGDVADLLVMLLRPVAEEVVALSHRLPVARVAGAPVAVVTVGSGPYDVGDLAAQFGVHALGALPTDHRAAEALAGRGGSARALGRTSLARSAREVAERITEWTQPAGAPGDVPAGTAT